MVLTRALVCARYSKPGMKVIVRNSKTKKVWTRRGNWSTNPARARDFKNSPAAQKFCMDTGFFAFEIVFVQEPAVPEGEYAKE